MWQEIIVGIIVALAILYAVAKYLPERWRHALAGRLARGGRASRWLVKWFDATASCGTGGGCGTGCGSCGPAETTPPPGKGKVIKIHPRS